MDSHRASALIPGAETCSRCRQKAASQKARGERMCGKCYMHYAGGKVARRMSPYKYRTDMPPHKMLLALSFGTCSMTMLEMLRRHLRTSMERTKWFGFELHVLFMKDSEHDTSEEEDDERMAKLEKYYTRQENPMIGSISKMSTEVLFDSLNISGGLLDLRDVLGKMNEDNLSRNDQATGCYQSYMSSLPSVSARLDISSILTRRFIVQQAKNMGCDTVLWGDSTTRLAERTLAETAKGRGFSLPWQMGDGPSPYGINFTYPMRDLLRKEIAAFAELVGPDFTDMIKPDRPIPTSLVSSRDASIDALMVQYFQSVEDNFPSIVANVVRTSSRLDPQKTSAATHRACQICGLPVARETDGLYGWAGNQEDGTQAGESGLLLCYGCTRSTQSKSV